MQQQQEPKKRRESSMEEIKNRIKLSMGSQEDRVRERMERVRPVKVRRSKTQKRGIVWGGRSRNEGELHHNPD